MDKISFENLNMEGLDQTVMPFIFNPPFDGWLGIARIVFISLFFLFLVVILYLTFGGKTSWFRFLIVEDAVEFLTYRQFGVRRVKIWQNVLAKLDSGLESEYKLAILEADNILDDVLVRMGYKGEDLEDKLDKLSPIMLPNIEDVRQAHKVRDNIVHDPDYALSLDETKKTLDAYEKALVSLEVF